MLVEISKQLEREALRIGETCVVASTFQHAVHLTPATARRYRELVDTTGFVCALGPHFSAAPLARDLGDSGADLDRTFDYALTYVRETVTAAAHQLLRRVAARTGAV